MKNNVVTIIVTYNGASYIQKCIQSVLASDTKTEIIIVDNCSTDQTCEIIYENYPQVKLIRLNKNHGFGYANNIGIKHAFETEKYSYYFLLNQDTEVFKDSIGKLLKASKSNSDYWILSPIHLSENGKTDKRFEKYISSNNELKINSNNPADDKIYEVPFVNAAAWFVKEVCIRKIGGFDFGLFFHYGEDENYCLRVLYNHKRIGIITNTSIIHFRSNEVTKRDEVHDLKQVLLSAKVAMSNIMISDKQAYGLYNNHIYKVILVFLKSIILFKWQKTRFLFNELLNGNIFFKNRLKNSRKINSQEGLNHLSFDLPYNDEFTPS